MIYLEFCFIFIVLLFSVESVWKVYTDTSIRSARTYLYVHHRDDENKDKLYGSDVESHAEQKFMNEYRNQGRTSDAKNCEQLDMYFTFAPCGTQERNCAWELRAFAEEYNLYLNIKAAAPYNQNDKELCYLMTSQYCTVEAFTRDDYKVLTGYLNWKEEWKITRATINRDEETGRKLKEIRYSKYEYKTNYSILNWLISKL